jgi:hypothetical protein
MRMGNRRKMKKIEKVDRQADAHIILNMNELFNKFCPDEVLALAQMTIVISKA